MKTNYEGGPTPILLRYRLKTAIEKISVKWKFNEFCLEYTAVCQTEPLPSRKPFLSIGKLTNVPIPPKTIYHPAIINATKSFYRKHPSELSSEECEKFNWYLEHERNCGEPVESDIIYLPSSMRNCLHCDLPTQVM